MLLVIITISLMPAAAACMQFFTAVAKVGDKKARERILPTRSLCSAKRKAKTPPPVGASCEENFNLTTCNPCTLCMATLSPQVVRHFRGKEEIFITLGR